MLLGILGDNQADESDRLLAAELAGDFVVINDELADALLAIVLSGDETATDAVASIRPQAAPEILGEITDSDDEDIVEAVFEELAMAEGPSEHEDDEFFR